ncbi:putative microtubule-associated protein 70-5-like [Capsicum annuum]|nr:putative microtubule-associated protein 70-5-like [Capsicum annuum]
MLLSCYRDFEMYVGLFPMCFGCTNVNIITLDCRRKWLILQFSQVKADKYAIRGSYDSFGSDPGYDQEEAPNSLEFSSTDHTIPGSPDDMFLKDVNPCLTPYYAKTKSKEFDDFNSPDAKDLVKNNIQIYHEASYNSCSRKLSKSSDSRQCSNAGSKPTRAARRSDESKCTYGKQPSQYHSRTNDPKGEELEYPVFQDRCATYDSFT